MTPRLITAASGALLALLMLGYWFWQSGAQHRALLRLPVEQRRQAVASTLHTLDTVCGPNRAPALQSYCEDQADFVMQFPECDRDCQQKARALTTSPAR